MKTFILENNVLFAVILFIIYFWVLLWKCYAIWTSVKENHKIWFVIFILPINTLGILEIIYVFFVAKRKWSDIKEILHKDISKKTATPQNPE